MTTIAVVGDVGGFPDALDRAVAELDDNTVVIQVGDLVDRGPDSPGVLAYVGRRLEDPPRRWIQLVGNHDAQYVGGAPFWPERLDEEAAAVLRAWWLKEWMRVAAAVRTRDGEELLVTHAGLTVDAWRALGSPVTASTAADLLNTRPEPLLWDDRGPLWAEAGADLYSSWMSADEPMPFGQIHGHSTIVDFRRRMWRCAERIRLRSTVDWDARHTFTRFGGSRFVGVDPKHGREGARTWKPFVLYDADLLT